MRSAAMLLIFSLQLSLMILAGGCASKPKQQDVRMILNWSVPKEIPYDELMIDVTFPEDDQQILKTVKRAVPIAWCLKTWPDDEPPPTAMDELILHLEWEDRTGHHHNSLAFLARGLHGNSAQNWRLGTTARGTEAYRRLSRVPTENDIVEFLRGTAFGHNGYDSGVLVCSILLYRESQELMKCLGKCHLKSAEKVVLYRDVALPE